MTAWDSAEKRGSWDSHVPWALCREVPTTCPNLRGRWHLGYQDFVQAQSLDVRETLELSCTSIPTPSTLQ